jgi:hypothetical protein
MAEAITEVEKAALIEAIGKQAGDKAAEKANGIIAEAQKAFDNYALKGETATTKDFTELKAAVDASETKLLETLKAQGLEISQLKNGGLGEGLQLKSFVSEVQDSIANKEIGKSNKGAFKEFHVGVDKSGNLVMMDKDVNNKAVDTHRVENAIVGNQTISGVASLVEVLRSGGSGMVETRYRTSPWILDFVDTGSTNLGTIEWWDELAKEGDFAITEECAVKPQLMYKFEKKFSNRKKIAGWIKISEEFDMDFPGLVSTIKSLMNVDCKNKLASNVLTDMIALATPYSNPVLVGQIDNADDWAAIAAAVGQAGNALAPTNLLITNNNRGIVTAATKGNDGHYLNYQGIKDEINAGGITHFKHPDVAFNSFIVGDGNAMKVRLQGGMIIKIGTINDDLIKNQYCVVVEQFYHTYASSAKRVGLITGDFTTVKASIEKP